MNQTEIRRLYLSQAEKYPNLKAQDLVKALYQATFGPGHLISDPARGLAWIRSETAESAPAPTAVEPIGPDYTRVFLGNLPGTGLAPETLFRLFQLSAEAPAAGAEALEEGLALLEQMIAAGELPVSREDAAAYLAAYRAAGCPAARHSESFRGEYAPAYRVIRREYARFLPLFAGIDRAVAEKGRALVAIEGGSASGKSTLGELLQTVYGANLFHMDDYFLQPHQRTPERFAEPGGNVDYERFEAEVLTGIRSGAAFAYRPFDCGEMEIGAPVAVEPRPINIVEGAYSMHPRFRAEYDFSAFLRIDPALQAERILKRNGPVMQKRFLTEWIPLELAYFTATKAPEACSVQID